MIKRIFLFFGNLFSLEILLTNLGTIKLETSKNVELSADSYTATFDEKLTLISNLYISENPEKLVYKRRPLNIEIQSYIIF